MNELMELYGGLNSRGQELARNALLAIASNKHMRRLVETPEERNEREYKQAVEVAMSWKEAA